MVWSFSRVNSYVTCPKMFSMTYLDKMDKLDNAFGQWGSHCHECLEKYFKGEVFSFELLDEYLKNYELDVTEPFPPNKSKDLNESYKQAGVDYFSNFTDLPKEWEVVGVEQKVKTVFEGYPFIGYIDLVLKHRKTGDIVIVDHKSKAMFTSDAEKAHYALQPYLYSEWVKEKYGRYPKYLVFNMFRVQKIVVIPFVEEDYNKAVRWLITTIQAIYSDNKFLDRIKISYQEKGKKLREYRYPDYFCANICSVREHCLRSKIKKKKN